MKEHSKHHPSDNSLGALLDRCGHMWAHRIGGKKRGQDSVLAIISQHPGITQKELGEQLEIQPASVSELLMKLERKGFILREKDAQDRRSIRVQLTEDGQKALDVPQEESDPFQALSAEEQEQLRSLLEKLLADWAPRCPKKHHHHKHDHHKEENHGKHQ